MRKPKPIPIVRTCSEVDHFQPLLGLSEGVLIADIVWRTFLKSITTEMTYACFPFFTRGSMVVNMGHNWNNWGISTIHLMQHTLEQHYCSGRQLLRIAVNSLIFDWSCWGGC